MCSSLILKSLLSCFWLLTVRLQELVATLDFPHHFVLKWNQRTSQGKAQLDKHLQFYTVWSRAHFHVNRGARKQNNNQAGKFLFDLAKTNKQVVGGGQGVFGSMWEHLSSFTFSENVSIVSLLGCSQTTTKNISQSKCLNLHVGNTPPTYLTHGVLSH